MIRRAESSSTAASVFVAAAIFIASHGVAHAVAPPPGAGAPGVEPGSVAPLVDRVKSAVVTIQSTKFIRRFAVEDPWNRMLREQLGLPAPRGRSTREKQEALGSGF